MNPITVVNVSTGDASLLTLATAEALRHAEKLILRTARHPIAAWLEAQGLPFASLDDVYDASEDFDELNRRAVKRLLDAAQSAPVTYAVADAMFDSSVELLKRQIAITVIAGVSHADRCLAMLSERPQGVRLYAAEDFRTARVSPKEALLLCELHSRECASECKLRLSALMDDETPVTFFAGDENGALSSRTVALYELDRQPAYDHLTACYVPPKSLEERHRFDMDDLCEVMRRLRAPNGCPWDREQTHESLLTYLLEECYEFSGAVREGDIDHMYDELGDVLLQVVFHAEIARQHGEFDLNDVTTAISQKMMERHTHIFGSAHADTAEEVLTNWDAIKRAQRGLKTVGDTMRDISEGLSPTMRAAKVQQKARKVGFDFADAAEALPKVHEEADEVSECLQGAEGLEKELGDLIFSVVNVCRLCGVNPDLALHQATDKFVRRFSNMENAIIEAGKSLGGLTLAEMDVYWNAEKQAESSH